jgi:hypothetical protein
MFYVFLIIKSTKYCYLLLEQAEIHKQPRNSRKHFSEQTASRDDSVLPVTHCNN